jgi:hypothetical protein
VADLRAGRDTVLEAALLKLKEEMRPSTAK